LIFWGQHSVHSFMKTFKASDRSKWQYYFVVSVRTVHNGTNIFFRYLQWRSLIKWCINTDIEIPLTSLTDF
jgi:hypothetical protein